VAFRKPTSAQNLVPPFTVSRLRSFRGLLDSDTCPSVYSHYSASAVIADSAAVGPVLHRLLPFASRSA
jgi:hypothetical protein